MRNVVLGRNARIWQQVRQQAGVQAAIGLELGHADLASAQLGPQDRVWVLSYSRNPADNEAMLQRLAQAGVGEIVYVSSSSTIIAPQTSCYEYPRAKAAAEQAALRLPQGKVLTLGLVVAQEADLPAGVNAATTIAEIAQFFLHPVWAAGGGRRHALLRIVPRPFRHGLERLLYATYGALAGALGSRPCLLRPLDLILRLAGMRWYGYTYLSNQLWHASTTS